MKVKFKKLKKEAPTPDRGSDYAAGWDLIATSVKKEKGALVYGTSISVEIPKGYFGILAAKFNVYSTDLSLTNRLGIIDSDYTGELIFKYRILHEGEYPKVYKVGDRIGQLVILSHKTPEWVEADVEEHTLKVQGNDKR